jgi:hypothetical protein
MHCIEHGGIKLEYNNTLAGSGLYVGGGVGRPAQIVDAVSSSSSSTSNTRPKFDFLTVV